MGQRREYRGIEYFKLAAALLVIAIHTSPLESISTGADYVLCRLIARVAVPFFFMVAGFFVLNDNKKRLLRYVTKTGIVYAAVSLLYLPVSIYAGFYKLPLQIDSIIKDILFDGTFYHLWYLPAVITGIVLVFFLLRHVHVRTAFVITGILYLIGLFGDSYYGFIINIPLISDAYKLLFSVMEYTRNGIFMAPIFILLGYMIRRYKNFTVKECGLGLLVSFGLLFGEGYMLYNSQMQRHDSMYFALVPIMYFLFSLLTHWKGSCATWIQPISMYGYFLHPIAILIVRNIAKILKLEQILLDNSVNYYIAVVFVTLLMCIIWMKVTNMNIIDRFKKIKYPAMLNRHKSDETDLRSGSVHEREEAKDRAWIELNMNHLNWNVKELKKIMPEDCKIIAVLKANAYGHGDVLIAEQLNKLGIKEFAVATAGEGVHLRKGGIQGSILVLGYTHPKEFETLIKYELTQTVIDSTYADLLNSYGKKFMVHVKVDTGMHRLGERYDNITNLAQIFECKNLIIKGMYSHLSAADQQADIDRAYTLKQAVNFNQTVEKLLELGYRPNKLHLQSSYGLLNYPEFQYDYVRLGIALYGLLSSDKDEVKAAVNLKPVLSVKARISMIKEIDTGESIGYGCSFTANKSMKIAVVSVGYADGIPRNLADSGNAYVLIHGEKAPIIGRICMDQLEVDISELNQDVKSGDIATLLGSDGCEQISAEQVAANCNTITNEILSRLGERLQRVPEYDVVLNNQEETSGSSMYMPPVLTHYNSV